MTTPVNRLNGKPWSKPDQDPLVKDVAHIMRSGELFTTAQIMRKTGMSRKTVNNIRNEVTRQPHPSTLRFLLRCYGYEIVIRPSGSNR